MDYHWSAYKLPKTRLNQEKREKVDVFPTITVPEYEKNDHFSLLFLRLNAFLKDLVCLGSKTRID
jgi:hypothetical protein